MGQDEPGLNVLAELWVQTAQRSAFQQLRSVEQLGYLVWLVARWGEGMGGWGLGAGMGPSGRVGGCDMRKGEWGGGGLQE